MESDENDNVPLKEWSREEKFYLYQALKEFSSNDIENIKEKIPTKNAHSIKRAINYYKKKAFRHRTMYFKSDKVKKDNNIPRIPLASWAKLLTDNFSYNDLHTETAAALRIIANFEEFPPAASTNNIDFKDLYLMLANAMEGKTLAVEPLLASVLDKTLFETALTSKAFVRYTTYKNLMSCFKLSNQEIGTFPKHIDDDEERVLQNIRTVSSYNPLNIPEKYLRTSITIEPE